MTLGLAHFATTQSCLKHGVEVYMQMTLQITAEPKITTWTLWRLTSILCSSLSVCKSNAFKTTGWAQVNWTLWFKEIELLNLMSYQKITFSNLLLNSWSKALYPNFWRFVRLIGRFTMEEAYDRKKSSHVSLYANFWTVFEHETHRWVFRNSKLFLFYRKISCAYFKNFALFEP